MFWKEQILLTSYKVLEGIETNVYNCLQLSVKLDLTNFQIVYNHKTCFGRNKFC